MSPVSLIALGFVFSFTHTENPEASVKLVHGSLLNVLNSSGKFKDNGAFCFVSFRGSVFVPDEK